MNWFKISIKNILENKYIQYLAKGIGNLLFIIAGISIIFNFFGDYSYNMHANKEDYLGKLLSYRNSIVVIFTTVWLFSLFLNKKIMVIIWMIAFSQAEGVSLRIDEFCEIYAEEYCADNNCDKKVFFTKKCQNDFVLE